MKTVLYAWLAALSLLAASPLATADAVALAADCDSCHGPGGVSAHADVPTIAGQTPEFLLKTLNGFRRWDRPCLKSDWRSGDTSRPRTDMCQIAEGLSDEEMEALAAHYGALEFVPAQQEFDEEQAAIGAALHAEHCDSCHPDGGRSGGRGPRLAGQWVPYLKTSLKYVPTGEHLVPSTMERRVMDFSAEQIDALMNFYASQQD
ncbi:MAG: c-type cytochrome [Gammaproteobacteria bacterium]|nr:c-type cytochrome [Gammaproteobacteria bacterium]